MNEPSHKLQDFLITNTELAISWGDGHQSFYLLEDLRKACPCAKCSGEGFGPNRVEGNPGPYSGASFQLLELDPVGHYGVRITWGDRHNTGIHNLKKLRASCSCDECR